LAEWVAKKDGRLRQRRWLAGEALETEFARVNGEGT
jgi:hypothetical protein